MSCTVTPQRSEIQGLTAEQVLETKPGPLKGGEWGLRFSQRADRIPQE